MSDPTAYAYALGRLKADTARYRDLPADSLLSLFEEFVERALLLPEAAAYEAQGIGAAESGLALILSMTGVGAVASPLAVKGLDLVLHAALNAATAKAKRDEAARQAAINGE